MVIKFRERNLHVNYANIDNKMADLHTDRVSGLAQTVWNHKS